MTSKRSAWSLRHRTPTSVGQIAWNQVGDGPAVVLVHGTPSRSFLWRNMAPVLAERCSVYLYDLLGYGDAGHDRETWAYLSASPDAYETRERFHRWTEEALAATAAGKEGAWAIIDRASRRPIGSTRYLALRPEHRSLEIGWTGLAEPGGGPVRTSRPSCCCSLEPSSGSGASASSSSATRATSARARRWRRCPRSSRESTAGTGGCPGVVGATPRGTAWSPRSGRMCAPPCMGGWPGTASSPTAPGQALRVGRDRLP